MCHLLSFYSPQPDRFISATLKEEPEGREKRVLCQMLPNILWEMKGQRNWWWLENCCTFTFSFWLHFKSMSSIIATGVKSQTARLIVSAWCCNKNRVMHFFIPFTLWGLGVCLPFWWARLSGEFEHIRKIVVTQLFSLQSHFLYTVVISFLCTPPANLSHRDSGFRGLPISHHLPPQVAAQRRDR